VLVIRGFVEPVLSSNPAKLRGAGKAQPRLCPCAVSLVGRHAAASSACAPRKGAVDFPGGTQRRRLRPAAANCDHSTFRPLGGVVWGDGKAVLAGSRDTGGARVAAGTRVRGVCRRRAFESSLRTSGKDVVQTVRLPGPCVCLAFAIAEPIARVGAERQNKQQECC
jgi:hypothetical protein